MFDIAQARASLEIAWQIMRRNSAEALFFSQIEFFIANGKLANRQGGHCIPTCFFNIFVLGGGW